MHYVAKSEERFGIIPTQRYNPRSFRSLDYRSTLLSMRAKHGGQYRGSSRQNLGADLEQIIATLDKNVAVWVDELNWHIDNEVLVGVGLDDSAFTTTSGRL